MDKKEYLKEYYEKNKEQIKEKQKEYEMNKEKIQEKQKEYYEKNKDKLKCQHEKRKYDCIICSPEMACENCKQMKRADNKTYRPYCFVCYCVLKLEAIGPIGLQRCIVFNKSKQLHIENVIFHCHEKLLKLKDEFIVTKTAKDLAEPLHQFIVDYVNKSR